MFKYNTNLRKSMHPSLAIMGRLFGYLRSFWFFMLIAALCFLLASGTHLLVPLVIQELLNAVIVHHAQNLLNQTLLLLLVMLFFSSLCSFGQNYLTSYIGERLAADLRKYLHVHMQSFPLAYFHEQRTGDMISRVTIDVTRIQTGLTMNILNLAEEIITLVGSVAIIFLLNWQLTLSIVFFASLVLLFALLFGQRLRNYSRRMQEGLGTLSTFLEETLPSRRVVKAYMREEYEVERFNRLVDNVFTRAIKLIQVRSFYDAVTGFLAFGSVVLVLWFGGTEVLAGYLNPGQLFSFVIYLILIAGAVSQFSSSYSKLQESLGAAERIFEILDSPSECLDTSSVVTLPSLKGQIVFDNVSFCYTQGIPVLRNLSFIVPAGQTVALVGHSGAGKTTITDLILRFFKPDSGHILIDGYDLCNASTRSLREQISLVPQEPILFSGTIRENIAYGRPNATQAEIETAAAIANATDFIEHSPQGYDTLVGERGIKLSVGQRQRIAIARAALRDAPILILDEATASLDNETEVLIQDALYRLMRHRTTLVIAHRLTTIENADHILVLDQGCIIEQGQHAALLAKGGLYARLYYRHVGEV